MSPLNALMNHVSHMSHSEVVFVKYVSSRAETFFCGVPLEVLATAQNLIKLPFQPFGTIFKFAVKSIDLCVNSKTIKDLGAALPGPIDMLKTTLKIIGYAIGTFFTATLGLLCPTANFRLHCALGLVRNEKAEAERLQAELKAAQEKEVEEAKLKQEINELILALQQKANAEQERRKNEEVARLAKIEKEKK
jgi:hypothetical protein